MLKSKLSLYFIYCFIISQSVKSKAIYDRQSYLWPVIRYQYSNPDKCQVQLVVQVLLQVLEISNEKLNDMRIT